MQVVEVDKVTRIFLGASPNEIKMLQITEERHPRSLPLCDWRPMCVCWEGALVVRGASGNTIVTFVVQYRRIVERSGEKEDVVGCR